MKNVICDICGTAYPSNVSKCPVCGSSREYALEDANDTSPDLNMLEEEEQAGSAAPRKNKEIFDFDEVNQVKAPRKARLDPDFEEEEEEDEEEEEPRTNVGLVIILVILIVLLLATAGFFFLRYLLPNMQQEETQPVHTTAPQQTQPAETTEPGKPCTNLMMDGGKMELGRDGKKLLNVRVYPEDTTDTLTYVSGDESIVTVTEDGTVTAVGEGQTVITITCGAQQISCNVIVDFTIGEETVPTGTIPGMTVEGEEATAPTDATGETQATESATEPATESTAAEPRLKLKTTDITIGYNRASVTLELDCDIKPEDINWFTMDSTVAIVHDGVVTSMGSGMTRVYGEYEGEQVMCIVRCIF